MNIQKDSPHRIDELRSRDVTLLAADRDKLIELYEMGMQFAPRVLATDLVLISWLENQLTLGFVDINHVRNLCQTERIHRELSA